MTANHSENSDHPHPSPAAARADRVTVEIERKYLRTGLPPRDILGAAVEIAQGYIPGNRIHERLRRLCDTNGNLSFRRTLKLGRGVERIEVEEEMDVALFAKMWPLTEGCRVYKQRFTMPWEGYHWELDEFLDRTLLLAEVELTSAAQSPSPFSWLAPLVVREVTDESTYVNLRLAK